MATERANYYEIAGSEEKEFYMSSDKDKIAVKYFIEEAKKLPLKRGDLVRLAVDKEHGEYRNDNLFIFSGTELEDLCFDYDDYGSVPPNYIVTSDTFSPFYWTECDVKTTKHSYNGICHNSIFFLSKDIRQEFVDNIKWEKYTWISTITIRGHTITLIYDGETDDEDHHIKIMHGSRSMKRAIMGSDREIDISSEKFKEERINLATNSLEKWKEWILDEKTAFNLVESIDFVYFIDQNFHDEELINRENICTIQRV